MANLRQRRRRWRGSSPSAPAKSTCARITTVLRDETSVKKMGKRKDGHGGPAQSNAGGGKRWDRAAFVIKTVECHQRVLGPIHLDGQAAWALESIEIKDMCMVGGEELVIRELGQRFPDKVAADRTGVAMEENF